MFVYVVLNTRNGKRYVGQTVKPVNVRWRDHLATARMGGKCRFHCAIRKHGVAAFVVERVISIASTSDLDNTEMALIKELDTHDFEKGYNSTRGGNSSPNLGKKLSAEWRQHLSDARRGDKHPNWGKTRSAVTRKKIARSHLGMQRSAESKAKTAQGIREFYSEHGPMSADHRAKIGAAHKGKLITPEQREQISESLKRYYRQRKVQAVVDSTT